MANILDDDLSLIQLLASCSFMPGSWDKRFVRTVKAQLTLAQRPLSDKQKEWLYRLAYKYREQMWLTDDQQAALKARFSGSVYKP